MRKNPGGISKQGRAHHRGGTWTIEDVRDALSEGG